MICRLFLFLCFPAGLLDININYFQTKLNQTKPKCWVSLIQNKGGGGKRERDLESEGKRERRGQRRGRRKEVMKQ